MIKTPSKNDIATKCIYCGGYIHAGSYPPICSDCRDLVEVECSFNRAAKKEIEEKSWTVSVLQRKGHTHHCACRIVWEEGECECNVHEKVYDPYVWMSGER